MSQVYAAVDLYHESTGDTRPYRIEFAEFEWPFGGTNWDEVLPELDRERRIVSMLVTPDDNSKVVYFASLAGPDPGNDPELGSEILFRMWSTIKPDTSVTNRTSMPLAHNPAGWMIVPPNKPLLYYGRGDLKLWYVTI